VTVEPSPSLRSAEQPRGRPTALREGENAAQRRIISDYLARCPEPVQRFAPHDDARLDRAAREGRLERVIFANLDAALTPLWKGHLHLDAWLTAGVQLKVVASDLPQPDLLKVLREAAQSYSHFQRAQRRKQTLAAAALSALILAAMAAVIWIIPALPR
jgi:hypothetical protein